MIKKNFVTIKTLELKFFVVDVSIFPGILRKCFKSILFTNRATSAERIFYLLYRLTELLTKSIINSIFQLN